MLLDIQPFLYKHFPEARLYGINESDLEINCPFCHDDENYHMKIGIKAVQAAHCFRCGYSGSYIKFVMDYLGVPYYIALGELYTKPSLNKLISIKEYKNKQPDVAKLPDTFKLLFDCPDIGMGLIAKNYLRHRGFKPRHWLYYGLGIAEGVPGRVIIPIENGYWQGRRILDYMEPKYINPKANSRAVIFNSIAMDSYEEIVVCEGAFSAMAIGKNAIALIGKEPTDEKCERIVAAHANRIIIALEPGAYGSMGKLMQVLTRSGKQVIVWKYSIGDPADPAGKFIEMEYDLKTRLSLEIGG